MGEDERTKKCKSNHYFPPRKKPQFYNVMSDKGVFVFISHNNVNTAPYGDPGEVFVCCICCVFVHKHPYLLRTFMEVTYAAFKILIFLMCGNSGKRQKSEVSGATKGKGSATHFLISSSVHPCDVHLTASWREEKRATDRKRRGWGLVSATLSACEEGGLCAVRSATPL